MERERLKSLLESLLFVADAPVSVNQLVEVLEGVDRKEISEGLRELQSEYEAGGRGFRLVEVAGGFQMRTPKEHADWIKRLYQGRPARMRVTNCWLKIRNSSAGIFSRPATESRILSARRGAIEKT